METRPTWKTNVLDSINRMMIRFRRMAVSWILSGKRVREPHIEQLYCSVCIFEIWEFREHLLT